MRRAGPFLWLEWAQGRLLGRWASPSGRLEAAAGEYEGYRRNGVFLRRTLARAGDDLWLIVDDVIGVGRHTLTLAWLMPDGDLPHLEGSRLFRPSSATDLTLEIEPLSAGASIRCALYREGTPLAGEPIHHAAKTWGWRSLTYAHREAALTLAAETEASLPLRVITWLRFGRPPAEKPHLDWSPPGEGPGAFRLLSYGGEELTLGG
jgi:hypothetical protein